MNRIEGEMELTFALECEVAVTLDLWWAVWTVSHLLSFVALWWMKWWRNHMNTVRKGTWSEYSMLGLLSNTRKRFRLCSSQVKTI